MENIRISNAILSRFDLVFLMLDDPDLMRDKKLSEHVMKLHSRNRKRNFDSFNADFKPDSNSANLPSSVAPS
jgi:DNA replicative helicase MCM subunit Mcm2 (Cdc46/Mcm family)